jgi:hypothetical protein
MMGFQNAGLAISGSNCHYRWAVRRTTVFFEMLGVTIFGLLFTPAFYALVRRTKTHSSAMPGEEHETETVLIR